MRLKGRDFASLNSYYQILKRIQNGTYKTAYAGLSYKENSGVSLLIAYDIPATEIVENGSRKKDSILGIDLGQACPVYWCAVDEEVEKERLSNGRLPRGRLEYPLNLEGRIRGIWKARRNLVSSLRRIKEQISLLPQDRKDLKKSLLKQKEKLERNIDGIRNKERNLMMQMNEYLANEVVRVALREGCKKIRMEDLENIDKNKLYFPKWNYGQLQELIEQKATLYGIETEKVNPKKTSQRCPSCGYVGKNREEVRPDRDTFKCPKCNSEHFADFVGAFNVAIGGVVEEKANA